MNKQHRTADTYGSHSLRLTERVVPQPSNYGIAIMATSLCSNFETPWG